jgi:phosphate starvation-inducible protein PhoH
LVDFLGPDNQNIRQLAAAFPSGSKIISRGNEIKIQGQTEAILRPTCCLRSSSTTTSTVKAHENAAFLPKCETAHN